MSTQPEFPTSVHRQAAEAVVHFAQGFPVQAVLLVNSCARGTATPQSDLDIALLTDPALPAKEERSIEQAWRERYENDPIFRELEGLSRFAGVHLDLFNGRWVAESWDEGGGPDAFEIEIGNRVAYSVPLWEGGSAFTDLQKCWLPYYGESLREARLQMVNDACRLNLERVRFAAARGLNFYGLDRLYHAFQEFLQALFIAHRVYPIAYNKWIREQVEELLGLAVLYSELPSVLEVSQLHRDALIDKAEHVERLLATWTSPTVVGGEPSGTAAKQTEPHRRVRHTAIRPCVRVPAAGYISPGARNG